MTTRLSLEKTAKLLGVPESTLLLLSKGTWKGSRLKFSASAEIVMSEGFNASDLVEILTFYATISQVGGGVKQRSLGMLNQWAIAGAQALIDKEMQSSI